jgi:hypothetical protein
MVGPTHNCIARIDLPALVRLAIAKFARERAGQPA